MPNRNLDANELVLAWRLIKAVRRRMERLAAGDAELLFAYRRKVMKELGYDERSKPGVRKKVKAARRLLQKGLCTICKKPLPEKYAVLDRKKASAGYTVANTRLIHQDCDSKTQLGRGYR